MSLSRTLDGFRIIRADRTEKSGKVQCDRVCTSLMVQQKVSNPDLGLLTLSARAFYLPADFSTVVRRCVYIQPSANIKATAEQAVHNTHATLSKYPDAPKFLLFDFNSSDDL